MGDTVRSESGIPLAVSYGPDDLPRSAVDPARRASSRSPGGTSPTATAGALWTIRQYSGFGTPEESNERYRYLLAQGGTGLSVALDLPTQCGYDSDHPDVEEEVGRVGVALDTLADAEILFDQIPLDAISTSFTINGTAAILLAFYVAVGEKQGVERSKLRGTIQNDILKEYVSRGTWIWPPRPSLRLIADTIEFCAEEVPRFNAISVAGAHFRDAGANAAQEMAFTLMDGITYCDEVMARGRMTIDEFAPQVSFFFYTHGDFFEEIAKYRAGRRRWAQHRAGALRRQGRPLVHVPGRLRRRRGVAVRAAGSEQHRARRVRGAGIGARWRPVDVHRGVGRAVRAPERGLGHARAADAAGAGVRDRRGTRRRSARRLVLRRGAHRRDGSARRRDHGRPRAPGRDGEGGRGGLPATADLGGGVPRAAGDRLGGAGDRRRQPVRDRRGAARGRGLRDGREGPDPPARTARRGEALALGGRGARRRSARWATAAAQDDVNLMPLLVDCAKAYCTVGEMVDVLKDEWGEFQQPAVF